MLRANPRVLGSALFTALGLLPLACGGAFSGAEDDDGGSSSGGSATGATGSGGKTSAGTSSGGKATGGKASAGTSSGGKATGGTGVAGGTGDPCENPMPVGSGYEQCDGGPIHRPSIEECASSLPRAEKIAPPDGGNCTTDADCVDMPHGYCSPGIQLPGMYCAYGCVKDAECPAGNICLCGDPVGRCVPAACTSDQDCGAGLRCQSYDGSHGCGILSFACQTPDDTCSTDADCAGGYCDGSMGTFTCVMGGCAIGRPFLVEGEERVAVLCERTDWSAAPGLQLGELSSELRQRAARAWARIGQMEHASVAAFARFTLQLLQLAAPAELVERATLAMADETRHARLAFGVASEYAGAPLGPGLLDVERSLGGTSLVEIVELVVREGCIGETVAALEARETAEHAADPRLAELLRGVADDELRHAELAWRFVSWALEQAPQQVAPVLRRELGQGDSVRAQAPVASAAELELLCHGVVPEALRQELRSAAFRDVIAPCAAALLARAARPMPEKAVLSA
jgi:hypothetical protein